MSLATPPTPELLPTLLDLSLAGVVCYTPVLDAAGQVVDFDFAYVNPAALRLLGLPAQPAGSYLAQFPESLTNGAFAFLRATFVAGGPAHFKLDYQAEGFDSYFRVAGQRVGGELLVSFTVPEVPPHSAVALRTSQAQALAARLAAEQQRARLARLIEEAPAGICVLDGPELVFELVNPTYQALFPSHQLLGRPVLEAMPELVGQPVPAMLRGVYETGRTYKGREVLMQFARPGDGQLEDRYFDFIYQARYDEAGTIDGLVVFAFEITEQVRTRQHAAALQAEVLAATQHQVQARELLYQVFAQTPAAICLQAGPEHRFEYVNEAYQQFFPGRQLLGRPAAEAKPEMVATGLITLLDHVYQTGETYFGQEVPWLAPQHTDPARTKYFNFTYQAYRENGQIVGISTFAYDVTEQVLARQQRAAQQQQLQAVFEQAPVAIFVSQGPSHVLEVVNPSMGAMLGLDPAELLGQPYAEAVPELAAQGYLALLDEVWRTGETMEVQERPTRLTRRQPGHTGYFSFVYQPLRDAQQRPTGIICVVLDVTEQVRARRTVEASAQRLQLLTDALPVLIAYLDATLTYRFANQAYQAWFHRSPAEIVGRSPLELVGEAAFAQVRDHLARALAGERVEYDATMPYRPGFTRHIHGTFIPDVRQGQVLGCYSLVYDVTELVDAQRGAEASTQQALALAHELGQANEQLTRTNVDLDNFIYTASHDLRAPIANLEGLLLAIEQELPAAGRVGQVPTMLGLMQGAIERFGRTIGHLTDISRLQQEHERPATEVSLAAVVREVQLNLAPLLRETGGELLVDVPAGTTLLFSEKNLRSVVYNLLSNALKYRHPDRPAQVRLSCQPREGYQVLEVQDNGLGLDVARSQEKLFGMFQRLHTHVEGSGVGLYMVKRMVENAGGRIEVQSQLGQGSAFRVYFLSPARQ